MSKLNKKFVKVSLRQQAVFISQDELRTEKKGLTGTTSVLVANLAQLGYGVSEKLLKALNNTTPSFQADLLDVFREVMGVNKNWTPLVKGWNVPTGETAIDHLITFFANVFGLNGSRLDCGHIIPADTFPLERYNGCPFCGTPFEIGKIEKMGQGTKLKVLELWSEKEVSEYFVDLLESKTALDATQIDSLKILLSELSIPEVTIGMKETLMTVIDIYIEQNQAEKAKSLFTSPTDILRYLWYKHTGFLQIIEPKTIIQRKTKNAEHLRTALDKSAKEQLLAKKELKLKYNRRQCKMVARWLNALPLEADKICEMMHPKRGMWVRFIRALRLAEYSKRTGFEKLAKVMDLFYKQTYNVWQGQVEHFRLRNDEENTLKLLKQRPSLFARSLFANMLWFGQKPVIEAFTQVIDEVPARLVFTLNMYAENYFNKEQERSVKPLGGNTKNIPANRLLSLYNKAQLEQMREAVANLSLVVIKKRFAAIENPKKTIFIDKMLFKIPVSIGDRSDNVQDLPTALMGTRFEVEGDTVRLFMQWGTGLKAQHLDMDLSARIVYEDRIETCYFGNLVTTACKHSGDIRSIPDMVGTAEYIEININELRKAKAKYVVFACNAYSNGAITPNMVVGWMNSKNPMHISEKTGVAYDPSCVQHQVRITNSLAKGLVFGVLDVEKNEIVWIEMPFGGQLAQQLDARRVSGLLNKLNSKSKLSIGNLLTVKAEAQNQQIVEKAEEAEEVFSKEWGLNTAGVTKYLMG
ncbi:MAG: hypothetical protein OHK0038_06750 [Flammeovirgaceae bacterium]